MNEPTAPAGSQGLQPDKERDIDVAATSSPGSQGLQPVPARDRMPSRRDFQIAPVSGHPASGERDIEIAATAAAGSQGLQPVPARDRMPSRRDFHTAPVSGHPASGERDIEIAATAAAGSQGLQPVPARDPAPWGRTRWAAAGHLALVVLAYALLTALLTWPVVARLSVAVAGFEALDSLQYTWSLWWSQHAWTALGQSPAEVTLLNHPWGGQHPLLHVTPMLDWLALPLARVATPTQVYNLLWLASFVLTATSMYALAFALTGRRAPAFLAGALFAFFANRMGHALSGHLTQLASWWMPLYVLLFLRTVRRPTWGRALAAGVVLGLGLLVALVQSAYFVGPLAGLLLLWVVIAERRALVREHLIAAVILFGTAVLVVAPWYVPFLRDTLRGGADLSAPGAVDHSVDALTLLVPSPYHPLWGGAVRAIAPISARFPEPNELEHMAYLGWVPLVLAGVGLFARRDRDRETAPHHVTLGAGAWLAIGGIALLLSLGPELVVANRPTGLPLPYAALMKLPLFRWGRTPERFNQLTLFCLALLAAQGLAALRGRQALPSALRGALITLALVETIAIWPFPQGTPLPPAHIATWRTDTGAVLHLPIKKRQIGNLAMVYQTLHQRPIVGGYIHRELPGARDYVKAIDAALTDQGDDAARPMTAAETAGLLHGLGIDHVVLHRQFVKAEWFDGVRARLSAALGSEPLDCGQVVIYDLETAPGRDMEIAATAISGSAGLQSGPRGAGPEPGRGLDTAATAISGSAGLQSGPRGAGPEPGAPRCATYGDALALMGVAVEPAEIAPGEALTVTLCWRAEAVIDHDLTVYVHLLNEAGKRLAQHDGQPAGGNWPTTRWAPGGTVVDQHTLLVPNDAVAGAADEPLRLIVGVYELASGEQWPATPAANAEDAAGCAPVTRLTGATR